MKHPHPNRIIYYGENRDGVDVVLIADFGKGNGKTSDVIGLAIVPLVTFQATKAANHAAIAEGLSAGKASMAAKKAYYYSVRENIEASCGKCPLGAWNSKAQKAMELSKCYAQHNFQNVAQAVGMVLRAPDVLPEYGILRVSEFQELRSIAQYLGIDTVRSTVVGDLGMLPVAIATAFIEACRGLQWLGYTHQWFRSEHLKSTHQASTQGPWKAAQAAIDRGWSLYHMISDRTAEIDPQVTLCPAQACELKHGSKGSCKGCKIRCNGKDGNVTYAIDHSRPGVSFTKTQAGMVALENLTIAV